jgi:hypothetical protein
MLLSKAGSVSTPPTLLALQLDHELVWIGGLGLLGRPSVHQPLTQPGLGEEMRVPTGARSNPS